MTAWCAIILCGGTPLHDVTALIADVREGFSMPIVNPPPWHVDPVDPDDDRKLSEVMERWSQSTGEKATKTGTIKRAIRTLWQKECGQ